VCGGFCVLFLAVGAALSASFLNRPSTLRVAETEQRGDERDDHVAHKQAAVERKEPTPPTELPHANVPAPQQAAQTNAAAPESAPAPAAVEQRPPAAEQPPPPVRADQQPEKPREMPRPALTADEKRAQDAIVRGVEFLRQARLEDNGHAIGYAAFPGLALLECGVPANDPAVQQSAAYVRGNSQNLRATYELALAVLFLDRLGEAQDTRLIRTLALRLVAGQNANGGWSYHCPVLSIPEEIELITFLRKNQPKPMPTPLRPEDFPNLVPLDRPSTARIVTPLQPKVGPLPLPEPLQNVKNASLPMPINKGGRPLDDVAAVVIPTPRSVDAPAVEAPRQEEAKPVAPPREIAPSASQSDFVKKKGKGGPAERGKGPAWRTDPMENDDRPAFLKQALPDMRDRFAGKKPHRDDNSNTHFAILALWAARRHHVPMALPLSLLDQRFRSSQLADGRWGYRFAGPGGARASMTAVGLLGLGIGHGNFREIWGGAANVQSPPRQDPAIQKGLKALGEYLRQPTPRERDDRIDDLYFLWTVERVAVLFDLETIGKTDWYRSGARMLLAQQRANGGWHTESFSGSSPTIDTCMALLFLRRTNLLEDLTQQIRPFVAANDPH